MATNTIQDHPKKKTRRRLRVSCVECTRRRQKCDREQPCGLCKSRGVEHLCRWELEPFARPPPARPPAGLKGHVSAQKIDRQVLYEPLAPGQRPQSSSQRPVSAEPQGQTGIWPKPQAPGSGSAVDQEVKEAAIALAQLSVARQGEYLGAGSLVCALYKLDESDSIQIPLEKTSGTSPLTINDYTTVLSHSFNASLHALVMGLPPKDTCDKFLTSFFEQENWRFGLPRKLILGMYNRVWEVLHTDPTALRKIKIQWLSLLYSIFSLAPECEKEDDRRMYFCQSLSGKRLAEDFLNTSFPTVQTPFSVTEGTAHSCLAIVLMTNYMCDRGHVSEAWKLIGQAVRTAQTAGFHRDPGWSRWKDMSEDEQLLRRTTWLLLCQQDRLLSFVLGRPSVIRACDTDVPLPKLPANDLAGDGNGDIDERYQSCLVHLTSILEEAKDKCLTVIPQPYNNIRAIDAAFEAWESSLPPYFACRLPDTTMDTIYPHLQLQRYSLAIYYYACRMILHRSLAHGQLPNAMNAATCGATFDSEANPSRSKCIDLARDLLRAQQSMHACLGNQPATHQPYFSNNFLLFEGAVTLAMAIIKDPESQQVKVWRDEVDSAVVLLEGICDWDKGDITRQALLVLRVLRERNVVGQPQPVVTSGIPVSGGTSSPGTGVSANLNTGAGQWGGGMDDPGTFTGGVNMQFANLSNTLQAPLEWMSDELGGAVSSFELLHSLGTE